MNRATWLTDRRAAIVASYDGGAREYDQQEYPSDTQREWVSRLVERLPVNSRVLDAPCGTGKYFPIIAAGGIKTRSEISALSKLKMDAAVGMALYKNLLR